MAKDFVFAINCVMASALTRYLWCSVAFGFTVGLRISHELPSKLWLPREYSPWI